MNPTSELHVVYDEHMDKQDIDTYYTSCYIDTHTGREAGRQIDRQVGG